MNATRHLTNKRGVGVISTVIVMSALLAATAVGVGVGRHMFLATELQTVAEVAATAAATAKLVPGTTDGDAISSAQTVVSNNQVDGQHIPSSGVPAPVIEMGNYSAGTFTLGGAPANAARATATATRKDLFPIVIPSKFSTQSDGNGQFTVTKTAIATYTTLGGTEPSLPIVLADCNFNCSGDGCLPPPLTMVPTGTNNSGYSNFTLSGPSKSNIEALLPSGGGCGGTGGTSPDFPQIAVASDGSCPSGAICSVNANAGAIASILQDFKCMFDNHVAGWTYGVTKFVVPIVDNGCTGAVQATYPVLGFATVVVDAVVTTGSSKGLTVHSVVNGSAPGSPGGQNFGTGFVVLAG